MKEESLFQQVNNYANRANPYPLYKELLKTPIVQEADGSYVISSHRLIGKLLYDPRLSSDPRSRLSDQEKAATSTEGEPSFLMLDPPEHDRKRRLVTRQFGPPHTPQMIDDMKSELTHIVNDLIDRMQDRSRIDIVDDFAYPFPVTVICRLLGVPEEDEPRFHVWADAIVASLDPLPQDDDEQPTMDETQARREIEQYMGELIQSRRDQPGDDMLSRLISDESGDGHLSPTELTSTSILLLIAGHETTVNLMANGWLTLSRNPGVLERLRNEPGLVVPLVEELLRFEPPVQFLANRTALADISLDDVTIPKGSIVNLLLAAGNRDPEQFADPDQFIPDRTDNRHFGFGNGIHYCFGAPLARLEVQIALDALARRLVNPQLVLDPPPYRQNALLRGPRHLHVDIDGIQA